MYSFMPSVRLLQLIILPVIAQFAIDKRSILPVGDISEIIPDEEADVAVLEEPEHLTWYHHGKRWKTKFRLVIGVVHTNYLEYVKREKNGWLQAILLKHVNTWVVSIYCHRVCHKVVFFFLERVTWPLLFRGFYLFECSDFSLCSLLDA